ncbi:MAG: type I-C CRISPR-associated protein Cas5c [Gemmiger sp.]|nr:type I-C CRISPR-associated protein Cas5c [Gemmiger sp.]
MSIKIEVWGPYACFSRCEYHAERVSYQVMTPSAARGLIENVYFHPGLHWHIRKIYLLNPIRMASIRRNEVGAKLLGSSALAAMLGSKEPLALDASANIQQRAALILQDVHYVIEADFTMTDKANPSDNPGKFQDITRRRLARGQFFAAPYFGCREFPAAFREWPGGEIPTQPLTQDLGYMLYDMDYSDPTNIRPQFFHAKLENGVLDLRDCEVLS